MRHSRNGVGETRGLFGLSHVDPGENRTNKHMHIYVCVLISIRTLAKYLHIVSAAVPRSWLKGQAAPA